MNNHRFKISISQLVYLLQNSHGNLLQAKCDYCTVSSWTDIFIVADLSKNLTNAVYTVTGSSWNVFFNQSNVFNVIWGTKYNLYTKVLRICSLYKYNVFTYSFCNASQYVQIIVLTVLDSSQYVLKSLAFDDISKNLLDWTKSGKA